MGRVSKEPWYRADRDSWYVTLDGKQILLAKGKENKSIAVRRFHELKASGGSRSALASLSVAELAQLWINDYRNTGAKKITIGNRFGVVKSFVRHVGKTCPASEIRASHVNGWIAANSWSDNTKVTARRVIKAVFGWAEREGLITKNYFASMSVGKQVPREVIMSDGDVKLLIEAIPYRELRDLVMVCNLTGMRPSEACRIEAGWIDWEAKTATFPDSKTQRATGKRRVVYLPDSAVSILRPLADAYPEGPLLRNSRRQPWNRSATSAAFIRIRDKLGLGKEATLESFRHGFATRALVNGVPVATVATLMGHTSTDMVMRVYSKLAKEQEHLRAAVEQANGDVEKKKPSQDES